MAGVVRVYDGVIPASSVDSIRFKKYSGDEEITIYTIGGRKYYIKVPVLTEVEEEMVARIILDPGGYVDLRDFVKNIINSREVGE